MNATVTALNAESSQAGSIMFDDLASALAAAQSELQNPEKTRKATVRMKSGSAYEYTYADISDVLNAVRPALSKFGIAVSQEPIVIDGFMMLKTALLHSSGDEIACHYPVGKVSDDHRQMGSNLTYARRYALCALVGIAPADDLDGDQFVDQSKPQQKRMNANQAKSELDWQKIQNDIETSDQRRLDGWDARIEERSSVWPSSYIKEARALVAKRRAELLSSDLPAHSEPHAENFDGQDDDTEFDPKSVLDDLIAQLSTAYDLGTVEEVWVEADAESALSNFPDQAQAARRAYEQRKGMVREAITATEPVAHEEPEMPNFLDRTATEPV